MASCTATGASSSELAAHALRWRSIPGRYTFVDAAAADGSGEEWQLVFAVAELQAEVLEEGALLRFLATEEPQRTRRGLRAFQCSKLLERSAALCAPCEPVPVMATAMAPLCKHWVRGGCSQPGCAYRHAFANAHEEATVTEARERWAAQRRAQQDASDPYLSGGEDGAAGKRSHSRRHAEFAAWLLATFGSEALRAGAGVLDVGGGGGDLAFELQCRNGVRTTLVEPREVRLDGRQRRLLRKQPADHACPGAYTHLRALLDERLEASAEGGALLREASVLLGLHADEATELIVDAALKYGRPFAVVPCCVFPKLFPHRRRAGGGAVRTTEEFCEYLLQRADGLRVGFLPVAGRNKVIFRTAAAPPQPERPLTVAAVIYVPQSVRRSEQKFAAAPPGLDSSARAQS